MFYKMDNNLTPDYPLSFVLPTIHELSNYNMSNANDNRTFNTRTALYFNSFRSSVIQEWNNITDNN